MSIILYTIGCPRCMQLEKMLDKQNITYQVVEDKATMLEKNFAQLPILEVDGTIMEYTEAVAWLDTQATKEE